MLYSNVDAQIAEIKVQKSDVCNDLYEVVLRVVNPGVETIMIPNYRNIELYTLNKGTKVFIPFVFALDDHCLTEKLLHSQSPPQTGDFIRDSILSAIYEKCYTDQLMKLNGEHAGNPKFSKAVKWKMSVGDPPFNSKLTDFILLEAAYDTTVEIGYVRDIDELGKLYWKASSLGLQEDLVYDYIVCDEETFKFVRPLLFNYMNCFDYRKLYLAGDANEIIIR